jgi:hypothetical protein
MKPTLDIYVIRGEMSETKNYVPWICGIVGAAWIAWDRDPRWLWYFHATFTVLYFLLCDFYRRWRVTQEEVSDRSLGLIRPEAQRRPARRGSRAIPAIHWGCAPTQEGLAFRSKGSIGVAGRRRAERACPNRPRRH